VRRQKSGSFWFYSRIICFYGVRECFAFAKGWLAGGAKPNVPLAGWLKLLACLVFFLAVLVNASHLFLKNVRWEKNKKHRVGPDSFRDRLTRCPFVISFLCLWSPVKMVCFFLVFSRLFAVARSSFTLAANGSQLYAGRDFHH